MSSENQVILSFPFDYRSPDNHPDDGHVAKNILEKILGTPLTITEYDFEENGHWYKWSFNLSEKVYYVVLYYEPINDCWRQEFGDYDRLTAQGELEELKYNAERGQKSHFKLIKTTDKQATIDAEIEKLNKVPEKLSLGDKFLSEGHYTGKITEINGFGTRIDFKNEFHIHRPENVVWSKLHQLWRPRYGALRLR